MMNRPAKNARGSRPAGLGAARLPKASWEDRPLLDLCHHFDELQSCKRGLHVGWSTPIDGDKDRAIVMALLEQRQEALLSQIMAIEATSMAGVLAGVRVVCLWFETHYDVNSR